jgi:hypothetical protein
MSWLKAIFSKLLGLFVDDVGFAVAILGWVILAGLGLPRLGLPGHLPGLVLFVGLLGILMQSTVRRSRK